MMRRHLTLPHTLAVVTDIDADFGGIEVIKPPRDFEDVRIPTWRAGRPQCFRRLAMFRKDAADIFGAERVVCTDLDLVVCDSLDPILDVKEDFKITRGTFRSRRYNGSMMSLKLGSRTRVYDEFTPARAAEAGRKHVGSDQSWLSHCLPHEKVWTPNDGVCFWLASYSADRARVVFFAGATKPWHIATIGGDKTLRMHYRGKQDGRCLLLGHASTLWSDVEAALREGSFDGVIASPEAARHWPGKIIAVADDDEQAEHIAHFHGFDRVTWCGKSEGSAA